jgi:hypothetical protein
MPVIVLRHRYAYACLLLLLGAALTACRPRGFWECTDAKPLIRAIEPPEGWLLHESAPGLFDGPCSSAYERSFGSMASEFEITTAMSKDVERLGFTRVPAQADSAFWCARRRRFNQFSRGDLLLRLAVEPLPFSYGRGRVLTRAEGRFAVVVALRNYDQERTYDCPPDGR